MKLSAVIPEPLGHRLRLHLDARGQPHIVARIGPLRLTIEPAAVPSTASRPISAARWLDMSHFPPQRQGLASGRADRERLCCSLRHAAQRLNVGDKCARLYSKALGDCLNLMQIELVLA